VSFTKAENANGGIEFLRQRLEPLDVKITEDFFAQYTTHLVVSKRNTPKGLLALTSAKYLVTSAYVAAIERVTTSATGLDEPSPLEEDFDAHWPEAMEYVPDVAKEPVVRPAELYKPDPERANIFSGYTFIFANENQY